jgi:hypothetical protein
MTTVISFLLVTLRLLLGGQPSQEDTFKDTIYIEHIWSTCGQLGHQQQGRQEEHIVSSSPRRRRDVPRPAPPFFPVSHVTSPAAPPLLSHRRTQPLAAAHWPPYSRSRAPVKGEGQLVTAPGPARPTAAGPGLARRSSPRPRASDLVFWGLGAVGSGSTPTRSTHTSASRASTPLTSSRPSSTPPWPAEEAHRRLHTRHNVIPVIYNH